MKSAHSIKLSVMFFCDLAADTTPNAGTGYGLCGIDFSNPQGVGGTNAHTLAAAIARISIDFRKFLPGENNGLLVATVAAGNTENLVPGMAGFPVQLCHAHHRLHFLVGIQLDGTGFDAGKTVGAAALCEVEIRHAGKCMCWRVNGDDGLLTFRYAWLITTRAIILCDFSGMPRRQGTERLLLPLCSFPTFAGQKFATKEISPKRIHQPVIAF